MAFVLLVACNGGEHAPPNTGAPDGGADSALSEQKIDELFDHALTFMEHSGEIIERNAADCPAMGRELETLRQTNAELIRQVQHAYGSSALEQRREYNHRYHDRYHAAWAKIRPGLLKCKNVAEVNRVVHELAGG